MKISLQLIKKEFESSCERTPQYLEFHRTFKREFTNLLKPHTTRIEIAKLNHFDVFGFFELNDGRIYYFSIGDLRWDKEKMLVRTAKHFKDYTGGMNQFIKIDDSFAESVLKFIK
jgi:hypothetical protein